MKIIILKDKKKKLDMLDILDIFFELYGFYSFFRSLIDFRVPFYSYICSS